MRNKNLIFLYCLMTGLLFCQNYTFAQESSTEESAKVEPSVAINEEDLVHFGDLIDVDIVGSVDYDWRGTLNPEGFLSGINFVENQVYAICMSEKDIAREIAASYQKILRDPVVVVKILDRSNRPLSVLSGAVKTPQRFQIKRTVFLNELLISSGGLTDKVSGEIQIFRSRYLTCLSKGERNPAVNNSETATTAEKFVDISFNSEPEYINIQISSLLSGKKEANPQIFSGDIITVAEAELIFIIGGVVNPKNISSRSQISLIRAIDSAGGLAKDADEQNVTIYRNVKGTAEVIKADLEKIRLKQSEDIILKPLDIVEVGQKGKETKKTSTQFKNVDMDKKNIGNLPIKIID